MTLLRHALAAWLLWAPWPLLALQLDASLSAASIQLGDRVDLVLETDRRPSSAPDLSGLDRDFRILNRRSQSSTSTINGVTTQQHRLILTLSPKRAGLLEVPPIRVGDLSTRRMQLAVGDGPADATSAAPQSFDFQPDLLRTQPPPLDSAAQATGAALLEAAVQPVKVRVQQQALLIAKVYMASPVLGAHLADPQIPGARLLPLGEDRYQAQRDGTDYSVYERRYALFPDTTGRLDIEPLTFEGWIPGAPNAGYAPQGTRVQAQSESLSLQVLPIPAGRERKAWLPARDIALSEAGPETYRVQAGKPLERVISIRAEGVMAADLPELALGTPRDVSEQRARPALWDERLPEGVVGNRRDSVRLTAQEPGFYRLPEVSLDWWDTDSGRWERTTLPARELMVTPVPAPVADRGAGPAQWSRATQSEPVPERSAPTAAEEPTAVEAGGSNLWRWITSGLGLAWLVTMIAWWRGRRRAVGERPAPRGAVPAPSAIPAGPTDPVQEAITEVHRAYEAGNAAEAREALLAWAQLVLPEAPPSNLARLAQRCREPLRSEILTLEQAFFSPKPLSWERLPVWERLARFEPLPAEEPASFRQKRPLKRRSAGAGST